MEVDFMECNHKVNENTKLVKNVTKFELYKNVGSVKIYSSKSP